MSTATKHYPHTHHDVKRGDEYSHMSREEVAVVKQTDGVNLIAMSTTIFVHSRYEMSIEEFHLEWFFTGKNKLNVDIYR